MKNCEYERALKDINKVLEGRNSDRDHESLIRKGCAMLGVGFDIQEVIKVWH